MDGKVYIVILNYKNSEDTIECLETVLRNDYSDYQVVVIDNHSEDGSVDRIKAWADGNYTPMLNENTLYHLSNPQIKKKIPLIYYNRVYAESGGNRELEIKIEESINNKKTKSGNETAKNSSTSKYPLVLIQSGENLGYAGGNNIGIRYARKKNDFRCLWILNNDTVIENNSLLSLMERADELLRMGKKIGIIGSKLLYYYDPERIQSVGGRYNKWLAIPKHIGENEKDIGQYDHKPFAFDYVMGSSMFVTREFVEETGMLCEDYFLFYEELDWFLRGRQNGYHFDYCNKSRVYHKEGRSTGASRMHYKRSYLSEYYQLRNRIVITRKFYRRYLPSVYLGYILTLIKGLMRGQFYRFRIIYQIIRGAGN